MGPFSWKIVTLLVLRAIVSFFALVVALAKGSNACSEGTLKIEQLNRILSLPPMCIPPVKEMLNVVRV